MRDAKPVLAQDDDMVIGFVTWKGFEGLGFEKRQEQLRAGLGSDLNAAEWIRTSRITLKTPSEISREGTANLTEGDIQVQLAITLATDEAVSGLSKLDSTLPEVEATRLLLARIKESYGTILLLARNAQHRWQYDGLSVLRCQFDAVVQLLFILSEPRSMRDRAELYLDFIWILKHKRIRRLADLASTAGKALCARAARDDDSQQLMPNLRRIGRRYLRNNKEAGKLEKCGEAYLTSKQVQYRDEWYEGKLRDLAMKFAYPDEYELIYRTWSDHVHTSSMAMRFQLPSPDELVSDAGVLSLRAHGSAAGAFSLDLSRDSRDVLQCGNSSLLEPLKRDDR
jgi:hypothetical protein